ncbi:MAG: N-acetylglucosamine-6-phosphate deacetylase [Solobacterium sp.]|nr:N-acetylglucosamine-6-phosphate deacetylase [Solobacterium sp.]
MIIQSTRVYVAGSFMKAAIRMDDNTITEILEYGSVPADMDYGDLRIVPGFIDIHCHGAYGWDTNDATPDGLKTWAKEIVKEGVTSFLATTVTQMKPVLLKAVENVAQVMEHQKIGTDGAEILGIHFEGPYLNPKHKGAQPPEAIVPPSVAEFQEYQIAAKGTIRVITLAPELDEDFALTRYCHDTGVRVSVGHTDATYEQVMLAAANGAVSITHTYNAQTPLKHRENGVVGAAFRLRNLYSEIICDCAHSTPEALNIFFTNKGRDKAIMISDALMCKGFKVGDKFIFGGHEVEIWPDGCAHLTDIPEHSIAGSTMHTNDGLRNLVEKAMVPFDAALNSCTINPAAMLGVDDHLGKICAGYDADLVVLNDDYSVRQTFCKGIPQITE